MESILPIESARVATIIVLPFEDVQLVDALRDQYPSARLSVLTKADLAGLTAGALIRRLRDATYDVAVVSGAAATTRRHAVSLEILACLPKARFRFLRAPDRSIRRLTRTGVAAVRSLTLLIGGLTGLLLVAANVTLATLVRAFRPASRTPEAEANRGTVLFLRPDLPGPLRAGGSVSHVKGVIDALRRAGHRVIYVAETVHPGLDASVQQHQVLPPAWLGFFDEFQQLAYNLQLVVAGRRLISEYRPSLIYQRHTVFGFAGGVWGALARIPMVLEMNGSEVWIKSRWSRLFFERTARYCERAALLLASRVSAVSSAVCDQLTPYGVPSDRIAIVPNGVDPTEFHPGIDGTPVRDRLGLGGRFVVGFVGTFTKWHGVETLRDAMLELRNDDGIRYLLIGDGDLRSAMQRSLDEAGLSDRCRFTGLVAHGEVPSHLAACDVLVSPHLGFSDGTPFFGSPTKLFEYLAMGRPVIASRLEQIADVVRDGMNGLHFEPGDAAGLARQIRRVRSDRALAERLGAAAREDAERFYTWDRTVASAIEGLV